MSIPVAGMWWSGLPRVLAVLGVLVGVFVMHGLTGNHDVTMTGPHLSAVSSAADDPAAGHHMTPLDQTSSAAATDPGHLNAAASMVAAATQIKLIPADVHQHLMAGACLAMLTALVALLALMLAMRSLLARRPVPLAAPTARLVLTGRSPPWLVPTLSKLCVLRT